MDDEFIYAYQILPVGIKVEEISGTRVHSQRVWELMAGQIFCESGRKGYRSIEHYDSGAPYLYEENTRISVSHTDCFYVVASLQSTPECDLSVFAPRTALGVDAERADREQVLKVRERFLSSGELAMIPENELEANIVAWISKEALLKCSMRRDIDIREEITIEKLPMPDGATGTARVQVEKGVWQDLMLYSYRRDGVIVTVAFSSKSATLRKKK